MDKEQRTTLQLFFVLSPATFINFGYDVARYDIYVLMCLLACLLCFEEKKFFLMIVVSQLSIFIHEIALLTIFPFLIAYLIYNQQYKCTMLLIICSLASTIAIVVYGRTSLTLAELYENYKLLHGLDYTPMLAIPRGGPGIVWCSSAFDNIQATLHTSSSRRFAHTALALSVPAIVAYFTIRYSKVTKRNLLLVVSPFPAWRCVLSV